MTMPMNQWFAREFAGNPARTWLVVALVLMLGWLLGRLGAFLMTRFVTKLTARTATTLDDRLVQRLARPTAVLVFFGSVHISLQILTMPESTHRFGVDALAIAVAVTIGAMLLRAVDVVYEELMVPWAARQAPPVSVAVLNFARVTAKIVFALLLAVTVLQRAGFDVISVVTGLGIGGLAVALAAQETLGNLLGSLQIMTDRPFSIGDWIKVDGHFGKVTAIGLRSTRLLQGNGICTVIPNKKLAEATIENHSHPDGLVRDFLLSLTYGSTPAQVLQAVDLVRAVLAAQPGIHPEFSVMFVNFGDSALGVRVLYKVPDANLAGEVHHAVNLAIHAGFQAAGLAMAFPTRTVVLERALDPIGQAVLGRESSR